MVYIFIFFKTMVFWYLKKLWFLPILMCCTPNPFYFISLVEYSLIFSCPLNSFLFKKGLLPFRRMEKIMGRSIQDMNALEVQLIGGASFFSQRFFKWELSTNWQFKAFLPSSGRRPNLWKRRRFTAGELYIL